MSNFRIACLCIGLSFWQPAFSNAGFGEKNNLSTFGTGWGGFEELYRFSAAAAGLASFEYASSSVPEEQLRAAAFDSIHVRTENRFAHAYGITESAFMMRKNTFSIDNIYLMYTRFNYAVSNYITVSAGITPFNFAFGNPSLASFRLKAALSGQEELVRFGFAASYNSIFGTSDGLFEYKFGYAQGLLTIGRPDFNGTIGLGTGFLYDEWLDWPFLSLAGQLRLGNRFYLVSEQAFLPGEQSFIAHLQGRTVYNRFALQYGLWTSNIMPLYPLGFYVLPSLSFSLQL